MAQVRCVRHSAAFPEPAQIYQSWSALQQCFACARMRLLSIEKTSACTDMRRAISYKDHRDPAARLAQGACLQVGQMDLANASLAAAAAGGALSPSILAAQGKLALVPPEMPASGPSMAQRRLMIEQVGHCPDSGVL